MCRAIHRSRNEPVESVGTFVLSPGTSVVIDHPAGLRSLVTPGAAGLAVSYSGSDRRREGAGGHPGGRQHRAAAFGGGRRPTSSPTPRRPGLPTLAAEVVACY